MFVGRSIQERSAVKWWGLKSSGNYFACCVSVIFVYFIYGSNAGCMSRAKNGQNYFVLFRVSVCLSVRPVNLSNYSQYLENGESLYDSLWKSHISFQSVLKSVTFNDLERRYAILWYFSEVTTTYWLKLDSYCLQQECSSKTLIFGWYVSHGDIRGFSPQAYALERRPTVKSENMTQYSAVSAKQCEIGLQLSLQQFTNSK